MHSAVINIEVVELNFRIILSLHFGYDFAPHTAGAQNIGLVNAGNLAATLFRSFKGKAGNTLDFRTSVQLYIASLFNAVSIEMSFVVLAKINAAGELAHDQKVSAFSTLSLQRRQMSSEFRNGHGAQVAIQAQRLANAQKSLFRTDGGIHIIPFRAAYGTQQYCVSSLSGSNGCFRQGYASSINSAATDELFIIFDFKAKFLGSSVEHFNSCINNLYADAIARQ